MFKLSIPFWRKDSGSIMTHQQGLTQDQLDALKELKVGDRLILWLENRAEGSTPNYKLKVYQKPGQSKDVV